jgi:acetyl esterase
MTTRAEPRAADLTTRATRILIRVIFWLTRIQRRPPKPPGRVEAHRYGPHPAETLQVIEPRASATRRTPIVFAHGGGWIAGRKESYTRYLSFLAEAGYPVFNVEYPLAPENPHPGILRSLFRALDWVASRHPEVPGVHVMGDSAGGNLAMMIGLLAANPGLVRAVSPDHSDGLPLACHSVVSLYGVLDRLSWIEDGFPGAKNMLESYAGPNAFQAKVDPDLAVTPMDLEFDAAPPSFLCAGTEDPLCRSSRLFAERLAAGPGKVVHREYSGEGHGFFNLGRSTHDAELREDVLAFLDSVDPTPPSVSSPA